MIVVFTVKVFAPDVSLSPMQPRDESELSSLEKNLSVCAGIFPLLSTHLPYCQQVSSIKNE